MKKIYLLLLLILAIGQFSFAQKQSGGSSHSLFICPDGSVKAVGNGRDGQLGLSSAVSDVLLPQTVSSLSGTFIAVAAGGYHSLFLKNDGSVWTCGKNQFGQSGIGSIFTQKTPIQISGLSGTITAISAGFEHSLFLKSDGTVWACGSNTNGRLGIGNNVDQKTPVQVGGLTGIIAIAAGREHSLFLKSDGTVWASGTNNLGQLGSGNYSSSNVPVQVQDVNGPLTGIIAIAAGENSSVFLKNNGTVSVCGTDNCNRPGWSMPETKFRNTAYSIDNLNGVTAIAAGIDFFLFLKNDGTVWGRGKDSYARLGDEGFGYHRNLSEFFGLTGITEMQAGALHSLFRKNDGSIWVCGYNSNGQLATGDANCCNGVTTRSISAICPPPAPPQVNYSSMPNTTCVGSNVNFGPNISGSNPVTAVGINSINIANPKAIDKNSHAVFVLDDNNQITKFNLNGSVASLYPNLSITGIQAFTVDDSSNVYIFNGDGNVYKCDSTGTLVNTQSTLWLGTNANDLAYTKPLNKAMYPENLFLLDNTPGANALITGIDTYNNDNFSNSNIYPTNSTYVPKATSISIDNFYGNKRVLMADPVNGTLRSRVLYSDGSSNFDYKDGYLVDSTLTGNLGFDFIDSDTTFKMITVSSKTTGKLGVISCERRADGSESSSMDTVITSMINPTQPVGMIITKFGSSFQFWVADRGQNKLLRAFIYNYKITPPLPAGLTFNNNTGKIEGTPKAVSSPQTYQIIMNSPLGNDTTYVTIAITPTTGVSNSVGTNTTSAAHNDGMTIRYFDPYTCSSLIELKDSVGGTSPGATDVVQYVRPTTTTVGNKTFVRRSTTIASQQNQNINAKLKLMYSYEDFKQFNLANPSNQICNLAGTNCNDTIAGVMNIAVLQMHEVVNPSTGFLEKEPIFHSPITATWNTSMHMWVTDNILLTKLSDFYAGPTSNATGFDCSSTGRDTLVANDFFVWNNDSIFASGDYVDTLVNITGCDSVARLHLTINITTGLSEAANGSGISVYPNPNNGLFNIHFSSNAIEPTRVRVLNVLGTEVYNKIHNSNTTINLSEVENGVYFVMIDYKDKPIVWRIVKQE